MSVRELALSMLTECELEGKYVNLILNSRRTDKLSAEERASLTALLYTVTERKHTYDYYISAVAKRSLSDIDLHTLNILRLGVCQIVGMSAIPDFAAVNESVKLARNPGERSFVNGVLRSIVRMKESDSLPMPDRKKSEARYLSVLHSFPLWLTKHFISLVGEADADRLLAEFNKHDTTDITVNTLRTTREDLLSRLRDAGISAEPSQLSPISIRILGSCDPRRLPGFAEGHFFVQDAASAISALALAPKADSRILDVCACPGGKSFAASIISGGASVLALDLHESKLSLITSGAERLGLDIRAEVQDATMPREELYASFDRVICDCPCSGLGVLGKKSDMRYRDPASLSELPELQYRILEQSARYLASGGYMVYSTCTLNPDENERVVERFLEGHPDFTCESFEIGDLAADGGMLTLYPHLHGTDGFFVAKLKRVHT